MKMIRYLVEVTDYLYSLHYDRLNYRIAVEALIFTPDGKLIQGKRGKKAMDEVGKLEGIGGSIGHYNDLHEVLQERIRTELGSDVTVKIDRLLEIRQVQFEDRDRGLLDWVVVSYLCRLIEGEPMIGEPEMTESLHYLTLEDLLAMDETKLSPSTIIARATYRSHYGNRLYYEIA